MVFCGDAAGGFALDCGMALGWKSEDRLSSYMPRGRWADGEGHFASRAEFGRGGLHSSPKNSSPEHAPE